MALQPQCGVCEDGAAASVWCVRGRRCEAVVLSGLLSATEGAYSPDRRLIRRGIEGGMRMRRFAVHCLLHTCCVTCCTRGASCAAHGVRHMLRHALHMGCVMCCTPDASRGASCAVRHALHTRCVMCCTWDASHAVSCAAHGVRHVLHTCCVTCCVPGTGPAATTRTACGVKPAQGLQCGLRHTPHPWGRGCTQYALRAVSPGPAVHGRGPLICAGTNAGRAQRRTDVKANLSDHRRRFGRFLLSDAALHTNCT